MEDQSISLNKYISASGLCSRREADKLIEAGKVKINSKQGQLGNRVYPKDRVFVNGKPVRTIIDEIYIAYNKPVGIVCTTDPKEPKNIIKAINHKTRLFPIGRLDKLSDGLIFLTNDGDIVNKILRAGNNHEKEYLVTVDKPITEEFIKKMSSGIPIMGTMTKKCSVSKLTEFQFKIILTQGLNRQIRRMCEYLEYEVTKLRRTRIMNVRIGKLKPGLTRKLTKKEMSEINALIKTSSKTAEASIDTAKLPTRKTSSVKAKVKRKPFRKVKKEKVLKSNSKKRRR